MSGILQEMENPLSTKPLLPGEDLDELVLNEILGRRSIAEAVCVPYGPEGEPQGWAVVAPASGPMQHGGDVRRVYVRRCECQRKSYIEGSVEGSNRIAGHGAACLEPVPRYSLEEFAALPLLKRFPKVDLQKDRKRGKEEWALTSYEPGLYVEGVSLSHVLSLAVVEWANLKCPT